MPPGPGARDAREERGPRRPSPRPALARGPPARGPPALTRSPPDRQSWAYPGSPGLCPHLQRALTSTPPRLGALTSEPSAPPSPPFAGLAPSYIFLATSVSRNCSFTMVTLPGHLLETRGAGLGKRRFPHLRGGLLGSLLTLSRHPLGHRKEPRVAASASATRRASVKRGSGQAGP